MYAVVTGTDHGVGLSLAKGLLKRGFYVVACRVNEGETQIDTLAQENDGKMSVVTVDIGSDESVKAMKERVTKLIPQVDLLINDAGILGDMEKVLGDDLDFDEIARVINVNAIGTLRVTNALAEWVEKSDMKTVVNISSEAGSIQDCFREGWFGYGMSKAANNMQSALVHNNLRKLGGKVIVIHPGHVATYMRGHLDTTAKIGPDESAAGILNVVLDSKLPVEERPQYVNYKGGKLPW